MEKDKFYYMEWLDHTSCYDEWTDVEDMEFDQEAKCFSVGMLVKETEDSYFLALSKDCDKDTYNSVFQVIKSCVIEGPRELK